MSDVQFNEPEFAPSRDKTVARASALSRLMIKLGIAKDEKSAQMPLVFLLIIIVAITLGLVFFVIL